MENEIEFWKDIEDFEGTYQVSNFGRIKRIIDSYGNSRETIMYQGVNMSGYCIVYLTTNENNKKKMYTVHRLVALAFIPNPKNKPQVNHIDSNRENAHFSNLEWVTNSENQLHAFKVGTQVVLRGEDNGAAKLTEKEAIEIFNSPDSKYSLAKKYNISRRIVRLIKNKERWKHIHKDLV